MVSTALFTGLSGLRVHQNYIDVIGNNLANVSTPGFRGSRATFSDILSYTVRAGSGPSGSFGGLNPMQIGHGAVVASVDMDTNQGTFQDTGRPFDIAMQGKGFFTLTDGIQQFYTRVGSFEIDANRQLVDLRTGLRLMSSTGSAITVPTNDTLPAQPTGEVGFRGNLPAVVGGPLEEIVQSATALKAGVAAIKTTTTTGGAQYNLGSGTGRTLLVSVNGGAQQSVTLPAGPLVNASQIKTAFDNAGITGLEVTADNSIQSLEFATVRLGQSATLKFDDGPSSTGLLNALGLNATLEAGSESPALATTDLGRLTARNRPYSAGDRISVSGNNPDGTVFSNTFVYGNGTGQNGTTIQDLLTFINGSPTVNGTIDNAQATVSLTSDGNLRFTATDKEPASMSLFLGDVSGNTGTINWPNFTVLQNGTGPDEAITEANVIDSQGRSHQVTLTFTRSTTDTTVWDLRAAIDPTEGTLNQGSISQIRFNNDGSFNVIGGGTNTLQFTWNGISAAQTVTVDLGTSGAFDGVAMLGSSTSVVSDGDGYGPGTLLNAGFDERGQLTGYYSNGQTQVLDTLRISMFANEAGLLREGNTLFIESPNSNDAVATTATAGGAGTVRSGSLENSNVDIAREFVNLIEAQRGFQANSRVITTTDEILAELINIVR